MTKTEIERTISLNVIERVKTNPAHRIGKCFPLRCCCSYPRLHDCFEFRFGGSYENMKIMNLRTNEAEQRQKMIIFKLAAIWDQEISVFNLQNVLKILHLKLFKEKHFLEIINRIYAIIELIIEEFDLYLYHQWERNEQSTNKRWLRTMFYFLTQQIIRQDLEYWTLYSLRMSSLRSQHLTRLLQALTMSNMFSLTTQSSFITLTSWMSSNI